MNATTTRIANFVREEKLLTGLLAALVALVIAGVALIIVVGVEEPAEGGTDIPTISYSCSGIPSTIPCSLMFPNNPAFQHQIVVVTP